MVIFHSYVSLPEGNIINIIIANLRYPAKNDKFFAGERRYSH